MNKICKIGRILFIIVILLTFSSATFYSGDEKEEIVLATWNLGHFAKGKRSYSLVKSSELYDYSKKLRSIINDSIKPDVICFNEYSVVLGVDSSNINQLTKDVIFYNFKRGKEGKQVGYSCNAIFSNKRIKRFEECSFESSKPFLKELPRAAAYYYLSSDLYISGSKVKLVCVHTTSGAPKVCQAQIAELIEKFDKVDKVIMCGDWNTQSYTRFKKAGYQLANDGSYKTYPAKEWPLDNIVAKGVKISDVHVVKTDLSDHYPLVCKISLE